MQIITHRGLEPLNKNFTFKESSKEAFENQLSRGYGLEFDINISKDNKYFIFHDKGFNRITNGTNKSLFKDLNYIEIKQIGLENGITILTFEELIKLISAYRNSEEYSALHLKGPIQNNETLEYIAGVFKKFNIYDKVFIFDIKIDTAKYIKDIDNSIKLFPSVAHNYDIERFKECTGGTLLSVNEVIENKKYFDGVWLDEWDKKDKNKTKIFYSKEIFDTFKNLGLKIGLVTPELHSSSPGLLGGEMHEDCINNFILYKRFEEIISLKPNFICCDNIGYVNN